jgi:hypothetical protein
MALFSKSDPEQNLRRDVATARDARDRIAARLIESTKAVAEREADLQKMVLAAAPDDELIKVEIALDTVERREGTLQAALVEAEVLVEKHEAALAALLDAATRAKTAASLVAMALDIEEASTKTVAAMAVLSEAVSRAAFISESAGLAVYASASLVQIPEATQYTTGLLRERARLCIAGETSPTLPTPEQPYKAPVLVKPVTRRVFSVKPVSWTDRDGNLRTGQRYTDCDMPADCARRAIDAGVAVEMTSSVRNASTHNQWSGHPNPANCHNLDAPGEAKADTVDEQPRGPDEIHSAFQPLDRGKPYALGVAR